MAEPKDTRVWTSQAARRVLVKFFDKLREALDKDEIKPVEASKAIARVEPICTWAIEVHRASGRGTGQTIRKGKEKVTGVESPEDIKDSLRDW